MTWKHFLPLAAAVVLTTSCSDDPTGPEGPADNGTTEGKAYVHFSINLPSTSANARANDNFADGLTSEYAVSSAYLVTFIGDTNGAEGDATLNEVIELTNLQPWNLVGETTDQVTTEANIIAELNGKPAATKQLYAMIVLNADATFMNTNFAKPAAGATGAKFSECAVKTSSTMTNGTNLIMMNAPLAFTGTDNSLAVKTLVPVSTDDICLTEAEAATKTPLDIYVERGVAKLTMINNSASDKTVNNALAVTDVTGNQVTIDINGWALDLANTTSYVLHNVADFATTWQDAKRDDETNNRFYGITAVGNDTYYSAAKRIYWANDPNYNTDITDTSAADYPFTKLTATTGDAWHTGEAFATAVEYPLENTFDVAHMHQYQTTRVVVKGIINTGSTASDKTLYRVGSSTKLYDLANLKELVKSVAATATGKEFALADVPSGIADAGLHSLTAADFTATQPTDAELTTINNALGQINTFKDGECYYKVLIKHFGDEMTPWAAGDPTYGDDAATANKKYLGRYGMVRNNWYELSVNSVNSIGTSTLPEIPDAMDDETHSYLNVTCRILSWAKRTQNVQL